MYPRKTKALRRLEVHSGELSCDYMRPLWPLLTDCVINVDGKIGVKSTATSKAWRFYDGKFQAQVVQVEHRLETDSLFKLATGEYATPDACSPWSGLRSIELVRDEQTVIKNALSRIRDCVVNDQLRPKELLDALEKLIITQRDPDYMKVVGWLKAQKLPR